MHHTPSARRARTVTIAAAFVTLLAAELGVTGLRLTMPDSTAGSLAVVCLGAALVVSLAANLVARRPAAQLHFVAAGDRFRGYLLTGIALLSVAVSATGMAATPFMPIGDDVAFAGFGGIAGLFLMTTFLPPAAERE